MSATYNNAILGPPLKVGVIASANATPNFVIPDNSVGLSSGVSLDGGLITSNGPNSPTLPTPSDQYWWIGPDGTTSAPILSDFTKGAYSSFLSGLWFDPEYNVWGIVTDPAKVPYRLGYLFNNNGSFSYKAFKVSLVLNAIDYYYFSSPPNPQNFVTNFSNNFIYGGIDRLVLGTINTQYGTTSTELMIPYGVTSQNYAGAYTSKGAPDTCLLTNNEIFPAYSGGPVYRTVNKNLICTLALNNSPPCNGDASKNYGLLFSDSQGQWHVSYFNSNLPAYVGRLWNGFVYAITALNTNHVNPIDNYTGCVYTEDNITFYPLVDITGQIDFTQSQNFGLLGAYQLNTYFMSGFGYSYLAAYSGYSVFSQAAYKIYPAFPFLPMTVPDSFFIPSVCGCNRRSNRA